MEFIKWETRFELGVEDIDLQHRYFVDLINRFIKQLETSTGEFQDMLFNELVAYAKFHFISEQNMMYQKGYPNFKKHKKQHLKLIDELSARLILFNRKVIGTEKIIEFLFSWFIDHTMQEDLLFAEYLNQKH